MSSTNRRAIQIIRRCVAAERFRLSAHFRQRLAERGLLWGDLQIVLDQPSRVIADGRDEYDRPKWIVEGVAADGLRLALVCVLDHGPDGELVVFITAYWRGA